MDLATWVNTQFDTSKLNDMREVTQQAQDLLKTVEDYILKNLKPE